MNKTEIESLLIKNGYTKHLVFNFYCIAKKNLGYFFYINDNEVIIGKIKWGNIDVREVKAIKTKSFSPHNYSLITDLDRKQIASQTQRMAINRAKHKAALEKGYIEPEEIQKPEE